MTDETGTVIIKDLDEVVYTVEEVTAPDGYCLDAENHKDIALEWGKTKTLIFEDAKKPMLQTVSELEGKKVLLVLVRNLYDDDTPYDCVYVKQI